MMEPEALNYLGLIVEDKVTGIKGVVTSISFDLYGCVQALVDPGIDKNGKTQDRHWMDLVRLDVIKKKPVITNPFEGMLVGKGPAEKPIK